MKEISARRIRALTFKQENSVPSPPTRKYATASDTEPEMPTHPATALIKVGRVPINNRRPLSFILDFPGVKGLPLEAPFQWRLPIKELLTSRSEPTKIMRQAKFSEGRSIAEPVLRWIHLPANNMDWVEVNHILLYSMPRSHMY